MTAARFMEKQGGLDSGKRRVLRYDDPILGSVVSR